MADKRDKVTIKIPRPLYEHIRKLIENSGYDSPTDFIVYVLRDIVSSGLEEDREFTPAELKKVKDRLRRLGYL
jgi:Arc/MetJ-type ribon-helix-helix transcriptional regulator